MAADIAAEVRDLVGLPERIEARLTSGGAPVRSLAFNSAGTLLAAGTAAGGIALFDYQTRGLAARLEGGHAGDAAVTALLWSADGRLLLSGAADGTLAGWDVAAGACSFQRQLPAGGGAVIQLAWAGAPGQQQEGGAQQPPTAQQQQAQQAQRAQQGQQRLGEGAALISRASGPALLLSLQEGSEPRELPMVAVEPEARSGGSSSRGSATAGDAAGPGGQVAVPSPDGEVIYAGCRGALLVLRRSDLALLDVHKIEGAPRILGLQLHPSGKRLLVSTADLHLRTFLLHRPGRRQPLRGDRRLAQAAASWPCSHPSASTLTAASTGSAAAGAAGSREGSEQREVPSPEQWAEQSLQEARQLVAHPSRFRHSLFFGDGHAWLTLQADFQGEGGTRGRPYRCAAYCADGEYVAAACESGGLLVQLWEAECELRLNAVLEGRGSTRDGILALCWHPSPAPMQLLTLSTAGHIDVWAKAFTENWSAFAPDFRELKVNDEYVEPEDEFDANPKPEEGAAKAEAAARQAAAEAEGTDGIDIGTPEQLLLASTGAQGPLLHLPMRLKPDPAAVPAEDEGEAAREEGGGAAGAANGAPAVAVEPQRGGDAVAGTAGTAHAAGGTDGAAAAAPAEPAAAAQQAAGDGATQTAENGEAGAKRQRIK
ncbi:hypothetical protein ABPG75_003064 [Micractinium tetrahymenae]